MPTRAVRVAAVATMVFAVVLAIVAILDRASIDRFPQATRPFLLLAAIAYSAAAAAAWRQGHAAEPTLLLVRYRHTLLVVLAAYALSFLPLGAAVLPLGAATDPNPARSLARALRLFVVVSIALAAAALIIALRAEEVFRRRLEGLVLFTSVGLGSWHALAAVLAGAQLPAISHLVSDPSPAAWQRFVRAYRGSWLIAAFGISAMVLLFFLTIAVIQLERRSGPPR